MQFLTSLNLEQGVLVAAVLLLLSIFASKASSKLGIPALLLFLGLGMLLGSDGPGGVHFDNFHLARQLGILALIFILFAGGLDTDWTQIKPILGRSLSLATIGVFVTAILVAVFVQTVFQLGILESLLLGSIVSSTDAAAVFGVLRARNIKLRRRLVPLLEMESGSNDPMAIFLTIGIAGLLVNPGQSLGLLAVHFVQEMVFGLIGGWLVGRASLWLMNHLRLEYDGLYPVLTIATVLIAYGGTSAIGGSGFLAVYVAGVVMNSRVFLHRLAIRQFHDGVAWLMQIAMFLTLGLLVFPKQLVAVSWLAILVAIFLIFVARPIAVFVSLYGAKMVRREKLFISWGGLRGAVPIILATFPLTMGVEKSHFLFHVVFFVALASVLLQGTTLVWVAKRLRVIVPEVEASSGELPVQENLFDVTLSRNAPAVGKQVIDMGLPNTALIVLLTRKGQSYVPRGSTVFKPQDVLLIATRKEDWEDLKIILTGNEE